MRVNWFVVFLLFSKASFATTNILDIWQNNQAVDQMQQKKMLEAHDEFTQLIGKEPFHPVYQFNLGSSFIGIEDMDKAIEMYKEIAKIEALPPQISFATYYNLGVLYGVKKNTDQALKYYQEALRFNPDSKEIKINIELLFKGGKGGGKGDKKNQDDQKDKKDQQGEDEQPKKPQKFTNKKQQPDQFSSKDMSKNDVKKILDELKKQEQRIRAKHERKGKKEADREKSW